MKKSLSAILQLLFFLPLSSFPQAKINSMPAKEYTMLSLGDSYTIGERADEADRFPNQAMLLLHNKGIYLEKPKIIAKTGWTTDELMTAIKNENVQGTYD